MEEQKTSITYYLDKEEDPESRELGREPTKNGARTTFLRDLLNDKNIPYCRERRRRGVVKNETPIDRTRKFDEEKKRLKRSKISSKVKYLYDD